jgi:hypothetical protein
LPLLAEDGEFWAADDEYIRPIGGKLGAKLPEEFMKAMEDHESKSRQKLNNKPSPSDFPDRPVPPPVRGNGMLYFPR